MEVKKDLVACVGFPSPAANYMEDTLDLNEHLIKHPSATFFVRVAGEAMIEAGVHSGDILIVDRQLMVRRVCIIRGKRWLVPENDNYQPIELGRETDIEIWGVVTNVIHPL